jgi:hypothetical protein
MTGVFSTKLLWRVGSIAMDLDGEVIDRNVRIIMEKDRSIFVLFRVKGAGEGCGEIACAISNSF